MAEDIEHILKDKPNLRKKIDLFGTLTRMDISVKSWYWLSGQIKGIEALVIADAQP